MFEGRIFEGIAGVFTNIWNLTSIWMSIELNKKFHGGIGEEIMWSFFLLQNIKQCKKI